MWQKFRDKFIADCREWWKMWSSWLAVLWGIVVTVFWNDPTWIASFVAAIPPEMRVYMSPLVLTIITALPICIRLLKQHKLGDGK